MYIERVPNRNSPPAVLLRESWRENGKTKKRTVGNLSSLPDETVEAIRSALKGQVVPAALAIAEPSKRIEIHDARRHGHVAAIVAMIADRLLHGDSKLSTARHCQKETAATRRNDGGFRLSSFRDILESLSAITRSTVNIQGHPNGRFTATSRPTPYQQEIIRHLRIERHM